MNEGFSFDLYHTMEIIVHSLPDNEFEQVEWGVSPDDVDQWCFARFIYNGNPYMLRLRRMETIDDGQPTT